MCRSCYRQVSRDTQPLKSTPPRRAFGLLPPEGALFALRRLGGKNVPPRRAFGLLPPGGALFALRRLGGKKYPTKMPLSPNTTLSRDMADC